ncbi:MAG: hypothetical protein F2837_03740 [Actinobacteria bacterium]|uniref:Unannotated protein n=1 Tax=freshwater metagenome TaxID=449393 RepID=A0A6J7IM81_9ZZZZ|nr:hypothetical protein [Actinomycetota bacterium]
MTLSRSSEPDRRSDWITGRAWLDALAIFAVVTACVFIAVNLGGHAQLSSIASVDTTPYAGSSIFGSWFRFDGRWYDIIATRGYYWAGPDLQSPVAYFPAYPMLLRVLHEVTGVSVRLLGSLVTIACGAGMSVLLLRWCRDRVDSTTARIALVTLLVYPYAYYFMGAVYADALFALAVIGAFVLLERDHPIWAGVLGALATATRPTGLAVVIGLVAVVLWKREVITRVAGRTVISLRNLRRGDFGVLLSIGGLIAYMTYLGARFDAPLAFEEVQKAPGWDQGVGPRTWFKITWLQQIKNLPGWTIGWIQRGDDATFQKVQYASTVILQGLLIIGFLVLAYFVWKRLGWGYGLYSFALLAIPLVGTKDFQGAGRYLMAAFPCFLVLATMLTPRPVLKWLWWGVSACILLLWTFAYGRGYYLA